MTAALTPTPTPTPPSRPTPHSSSDQPERDRVTSALQGLAELPAWLAAAMDGGRVLAALAAAAPDRVLLGCEPQRLRAKGDRWLVRYRVTAATTDGARRDHVLTGELVPPGPRRGLPGGRGDVAGLVEEGGWTVWLPDLGLALAEQAADPGLPALPDLTEPERARRLLEQFLVPGRPGLRIASCEPDVVRYKPGSRCTVVYRLTYPAGADPSWPSTVVGKTHSGDKGAVAWEAMRALWETPLAVGDEVTLAEPVGFDPDRRVLVQGPVPGEQTLKDRLRAALLDGGDAALDDVRGALRRTAVALAALHRSGVRYGRTATWEEEITEIREVVDRLASTVPPVRDAVLPLAAALEASARQVPADPGVSAHHDFRPAQVLLHQGRVGFIDFDGACTAEPALDLGRFTAKLRDIGVSTPAAGGRPLGGASLHARLETADELSEVFVSAYEAAAPVSRARVVLWETTDLLTGLLHAWTKARVHRVGPRLLLLQHHLRTSLEW